MLKLHLSRLLIITCILMLAPVTLAQSEDELARESDESAVTVEERRRALTSLLAAASQYQDDGETLKAARALSRAGRFQLRLNLPQDAIATFRQALSSLKQARDPATNIHILNGLGMSHNRLGHCVEAETFLRQSLILSEQNDYPVGKAEALLTLSNCQNYRDHALALRTAQEALTLWQSIYDKRGIAKSYAAVGHYHLAQNNLAEATQSHEAALQLWRELNVASEQAEALINLGFIEYRKGDWQNVFTFFTQAQDLLDEKAEPYKMGQISAGLADAFIESGLPESGLNKYLQALEYYRQAQSPRAMMFMNLGVGSAHYFLGRYPEALASLHRTLADAEAINEAAGVAMCNEMLGRTLVALNDPAAALLYFETALKLYPQVHDLIEAARVRALMGQVYEKQGKIEKAREYYRTALETFRSLSDDVNQSATLYALGSLELKRNNLDAAEDYLQQSIEATENMRRVSTSRDLTAAFSATVHERYEAYVECLMQRHELEPTRGLAVRAFETSEQSRARSLAELLRATGTNLAPGLDAQLAEREKSLRQALRAKEDYRVQLLGGEYRRDELASVESELACLEAEYKQVSEIIKARYPSYEQLARPLAWDLRRIQQEVVADDDTLLLEYSLGAGKSYVWVVTRDRITSHEMPARDVVNEAAQRVYKLLKTRRGAETDEELTRAASELSRMILAPVAEHLNKRRIIIVADGALNYIPFQFLPSPTAEGEPLVAGHEIVNAPSASILGQLRAETTRRKASPKTLAAFGDPVFASDYALRKSAEGGELIASALMPESKRQVARDIELEGDAFDPATMQRLFYANRELSNLRKVADGEDSLVAAGFDATRERLQATDLSQFSILHFATHGFLDPARPEKSGLMLSTVNAEGQAREGFVGLQDIYNLRAPVDLVVLSACRTALGKDVRGEGLIGLTRGFMYAGASSVVASLWKVDDEATSELMKRFYANMLQGGMSPASALRAAQNSIRQEPQWRSPFYWAAFTLQGEYGRTIRSTHTVGTSSGSKIVVVLVLLALLSGGAWWWFRRRGLRVAR